MHEAYKQDGEVDCCDNGSNGDVFVGLVESEEGAGEGMREEVSICYLGNPEASSVTSTQETRRLSPDFEPRHY